MIGGTYANKDIILEGYILKKSAALHLISNCTLINYVNPPSHSPLTTHYSQVTTPHSPLTVLVSKIVLSVVVADVLYYFTCPGNVIREFAVFYFLSKKVT